MKKSKFTHRP